MRGHPAPVSSGKYGCQTNSFTRLTCNSNNIEAADSLLKETNTLSSRLRCRIWNETTLTYRCCPLCWTAMHEGSMYPSGCPKEGCPNKDGRSTHRYKTSVEVIGDTGRATLTLFDQPSEELFNASSTNINKGQNEPDGPEKISSIAHTTLNRQFLFHVRVTTANYHFISNMYSRGYTAESVEWARAYNLSSILQSGSPSALVAPSSSRHLTKGKTIMPDPPVSSATVNSTPRQPQLVQIS